MFLIPKYLAIAAPLCLIAMWASRQPSGIRICASYALFFLTPLLTWTGVLGVLTGFDGANGHGVFFGLSFYTLLLSWLLTKDSGQIVKKPFEFFWLTLNPIYLFTGPIPAGFARSKPSISIRKIYKRLKVIQSDLIVGVFFAFILAPALTPYLPLRHSTNAWDVLAFGIIFEFYVYFNFCGFSMLAWSAMRLFNIRVVRNFQQPFSATSVIEYWQRWHISLSHVLKALFFKRARAQVGLYAGVFASFLASAVWHGVILNFFIWGVFHSCAWCLAHAFSRRNWKLCNALLLVTAIVLGRIIFSEASPSLLLIKIQSFFSSPSWSIEGVFPALIGSTRNLLNLCLAILVIGLEIFLPHIGFKHNNYEHLRTPATSAFIAIYLALAFGGFSGAPVYGNR